MIVRRKVWLYRTHDEMIARRIEFPRPVTRREAAHHILKKLKKIVVEIWSSH